MSRDHGVSVKGAGGTALQGRQAGREGREEESVLATHAIIHPNQQEGATDFLLALLKYSTCNNNEDPHTNKTDKALHTCNFSLRA